MLNVVYFTFNPFEENTYLIANERNECWIIDPGMYYEEELAMITNYIGRKQLTPKGIINTHTHIDHIFGVNALKTLYNIPFSMHILETPVLQMAATSAQLYGFGNMETPVADSYIPETEPLHLGDDAIEVRFTPGHSPGSISFYYAPGNWVISGDVLFSGSIGRTDLPGGSHNTLIQSIKSQLLTLPSATRVLSGHGGETTIEGERRTNGFLI